MHGIAAFLWFDKKKHTNNKYKKNRMRASRAVSKDERKSKQWKNVDCDEKCLLIDDEQR